MKRAIVTIWINDKTVKATFSDSEKLFQKEFDTREEALREHDILKKMLSDKGHEIKLKDLKEK